MKFVTGAFIVLLCVSVSLIISFKRISAETVITKRPLRHYKTIIPPSKINEIPLPAGFTRTATSTGSFTEWLGNIKLRKNNTVYLYNGQPIERQDQHYAVLDISTGTKDLQQCADAVMRLRAEYYFSRKEYNKIVFGEGTNQLHFDYHLLRNADVTEEGAHNILMQFMEKVFINCGTYTVDAMTKPVTLNTMQVGDVFVKAGSPGHTMIVVDVAQNAEGKKIYLLAQSYMPAQDMHIVINPMNSTLSPWYEVMNYERILTPGWVFEKDQLKRWK